jgi:hypothetical protein
MGFTEAFPLKQGFAATSNLGQGPIAAFPFGTELYCNLFRLGTWLYCRLLTLGIRF